jgi:hypothetical protein
MMYNSRGTKGIEEDYAKVLDDAIESLRWARLHYHEPLTTQALHALGAKLGYLAEAMLSRDEGDEGRAQQALGLAQGRSLREQDSIRRMWEEMWWSH